MSRHRNNAIATLERIEEVCKRARNEIEQKQKFYYWEPKIIELVNLIQALRLSCDMLFRERDND